MRKIIFLSLLIFTYSLLPFSASAHVLKTDNPIGAVLHISPDDNPIAGKTSNFLFEIKDINNTFKPELCDCTGVILEGTNTLHSEKLYENSIAEGFNNPNFSYVFPKKGTYRVQIVGIPLTPGSFQPFTLEWDVHVDRESIPNQESSAKNSSPLTLLLLPVSFVSLAIVGYFLFRNKIHES